VFFDRRPGFGLVLAVTLGACSGFPAPVPGKVTGKGPLPDTRLQITMPVLSGRVDLAAWQGRSAQAVTSDIVRRSTVSILDPVTNTTVASTVTDDAGRFSLVPANAVTAGKLYLLEAVKGVSSSPSQDALRFRNWIVLNQNTWRSISAPDVVLDANTTAAVLLSQLFPDEVRPADLVLGKIAASAGVSALVATPSFSLHPDLEFSRLATSIRGLVQADLDPIASVSGIRPVVSSLSAARARPGEMLVITGSGFSPIAAQNTVEFGESSTVGSVLLATPTRLFVLVPSVSGSRPVTVRNTQGASTAMAFDVLAGASSVNITGLSGYAGVPGDTLTILGSGFDPVAAGNTVRFGSTAATVLSSSAGSLVVSVPAITTSAALTVTTSLGTSNPVWFSLQRYISTFTPTTAINGDQMTISGQFGSTAGTVVVGGRDARVVTWSNDTIRVEVPLRASSGLVQVNLPGGAGSISRGGFTARNGTLGNSWVMVPGTNVDNSSYFASWATSGYVYLCSYSSDMIRAPYNADGSLGAFVSVGRQGLPSVHGTKGGLVIGNYAYFFNEYGSGAYSYTYYRAPIAADGSIGSFSAAGNQARSNYGQQVFRAGSRMYVCGGDQNNFQVATINGDSTLGAFSDGAGIFPNIRHGELLPIGQWVYRFGGDGDPANIVRHRINDNGSLGNAESYQSSPTGNRSASCMILGKYAYLLSTEHNTWWRADLLDNDGIGPWTRQNGGFPNGEYHSDRTWARGNYAYMFSRYGLARNDIVD